MTSPLLASLPARVAIPRLRAPRISNRLLAAMLAITMVAAIAPFISVPNTESVSTTTIEPGPTVSNGSAEALLREQLERVGDGLTLQSTSYSSLDARFMLAGPVFETATNSVFSLATTDFMGESLVAAEPTHHGDRIVYEQAGLTEWWISQGSAFEQGWTVTEAPANGDTSLTLQVGVVGAVAQLVSPTDAVLVGEDGSQVSYRDLHAFDAEGTPLPASLATTNGDIKITVNADDAVYPVTIDPVIDAGQEIIAPDHATGDLFGESIATFGNLLAVSARDADNRFGDLPRLGRVDIFEWNGAAWLFQASVKSDFGDDDDFGYDVAINGDTLVVGTPENDNNGANAGVVRVYRFDGLNTWNFEQAIYECDAVPGVPCGQTAPGGFGGSRFGHSVAISTSSRIIVGAPGADAEAGKAFVYRRDPGAGNAWLTTSDAKLAPALVTVPVAGDRFGTAVDIDPSGSFAIVGSPGTTESGQAESGRATLLSRTGEIWSFADFDAGPSFNVGQENGASVAIGVDSLNFPIVVIGRPFRTRENPTDTGFSGVRVLRVDGGVMTPVVFGDVSSPSADDGFGFSVDFDNDTVLVGAPFDNAIAASPQGFARAYAYDAVNVTMDGGGGASAVELALASDWPTAVGDDMFGFSVAISPTSGQLIAGSPGHDQPVNGRNGINAGEVSFYQPGGLTTNVTSGDLEARNYEQLGRSLAVSGNRMAIGAAGDDEAGSGLGAVHLYTRLNASSPWEFDSAVSYPEDAAEKPLGYGTSIDMEGDWMAIGSPFGNGRVDVYFHAGAWGLAHTLTGSAGESFGTDVAITPGGETLYVGVPGDDTCGTDCGAVRQYDNTGTFVLDETITPSLGGAAGVEFGRTIDVDYIPGAVTDVRLVVGSTAPGIEVWTQPTANGSTATIEGFAGTVPADSVAIDGNRMVFGSISQFPNSLVVVDVNNSGDLAERELYSGDLYEGPFQNPLGFVDVSGDLVVAGFNNAGGSVGIFYNDPTYGWGIQDTGTGWTPTGEADEIVPGSRGVFDRIGTSVAVDGLSIVAGAPGVSALATLSGGAFALEYLPAFQAAPDNKITSNQFGASQLGRRVVVQNSVEGHVAVLLEPGASGFRTVQFDGTDWFITQTNIVVGGEILDADFHPDGRLAVLTSTAVFYFQLSCGEGCSFQGLGHTSALNGSGFGRGSIAIVGTDVVVAKDHVLGAPIEQFSFADGSLVQASPYPGDITAGDFFGVDNAVVGDLVFISAPRWDNVAGDDQGQVHVYDASTQAFVEVIELPAGETGNQFGSSVTADANWVVVGHAGGDGLTFNNNPAGVGLVHVFSNSVGYPLDQSLTTQFADVANGFGSSVDLDGNILVVGSASANEQDVPYRAGAAYSYNYNGIDWIETDVYRSLDDAGGDQFGVDVAIAGQNVLVGAWQDDNARGRDAGAVYYYTATPAVPFVNDDPALTFDLALGAGNNGTVTVAPTGIAVAEFNPELLEEAADDGTSIASAPLSSTDAAGTSLDSVPISSLPISSLATDPTSPLSSIPLIELGLDIPGGWPGLFATAGSNLGDIPINDLTLSDVFAAGEPAGGTLAGLPISSLDVGGTPISSLPISSLYLGGLNLDALSPGVPWCTILAGFIDAGNCDPATTTLFEATISGVPISSLPISSLPISSLPISSLPISSLPISSLNLAASPISSLPISSLPISSLPISSLPISSLPISSLDLSGSPISSLPISSLSLNGTPISSLDIAGIPISSLKLRNVPISSLPISSLPISSLPISSLPISSLFIADTPISSLPISSLSGYATWCEYLADLDLGYKCPEGAGQTAFLQNTTIVDLGLRGIPISSLPISSLPISSLTVGGAPISSLPISSLPISSLPISSLPISSLPISSLALAGTPISSLGSIGATTLAEVPISSLDVAGSPISSLPISSLPISSLPISSLPISSLPISSLPISSLPASLVINGSPISSLPISSLDLADTPISSLPISSLPGSLGINCDLVNCAVDTLLDAVQAGAVDPANVTIGDLQPFLGNIRLSDIASDILGVTRQQVIDGVAGNNTQLGALSGYAGMTLGELPLTDPLVANLLLGQLNDGLWSVRLGDLEGAIIDPSTGVPFLPGQVTATLTAFRDTFTDINDLEHFGDATVGDFLANPPAGFTFSDLGSILTLVHLTDTAGATNPGGNLGDLNDIELGGLSLLDLLGITEFDSMTIAQLFSQDALDSGAFDGFDVADFILLLLGVDTVPFSNLDFTEVSTGQLPPSVVPPVSFSAPFTVSNTEIRRPVEVSVQIPGTASYAPNTGAVQFSENPAAPLEPIVKGNTLTWTVPRISPGFEYNLTFDVTPTVKLGATNLTATARIVGTGISQTAVNVVTVEEPLEPNDFPVVTPANEDTVYLTYISSETDNDVFSISLADNDEIAVQLSSLSADLDFAVYGRPLDAGVGSALAGTSNAAAIQPIVNPDQVGTTSEPVDDFRRLDEEDSTLELIGVSNSPGNETELLVAEALPAGTYFVQVFGANGATNSDPAALQIQVKEAEVRPDCSNIGSVTGTLGSAPAGGETPNTIFLVNNQRMQHFYGQDGLDAITAVNNFAAYLNGAGALLGIDPLVLSVDGFPAVQAAYGAWDGDVNCSPESANAVVAAINAVLDSNGYRANLEHVVVVGGDPIIPMARLLDATEVANEYDFRHEFLGDNIVGAANDDINSLSASFWDSVYLSDEPYGETAAQDLGNRFLYVSDVGLGRLVETPAEITGMLTHFQTFNGVLDATTAAVLGYDFLVDSSTQIAADLTAASLTVDDDLADGLNGTEKWTRVDAEGKVIPAAGDAPDLISLNGHFDHYRALPADGDKVPNFADNFLADAILNAPAGKLAGSIVFSMGCHSGLSVSDLQVGNGTNNANGDWAQAFANDQAIFIGNTGFGYGDTEAVAYSERLMALFAEGAVRPTALTGGGQTTIGQALTFAKNAYASDLSVFSVYDEKALMEMTFYGLPFYTVDLTPAQAAPVPANVTAPDSTNLQTLGVSTQTTNGAATTNRGVVYSNPDENGDPQNIVAPGRPIQPSQSQDVTVVNPADSTELGQVAHGALILNMDSTYVSPVDPVVAAVVFNESDQAPEPPVGDVVFPSKPVKINTTTTPGGERQTLVLATGQFNSVGNTQRLDNNINTVVYYSGPGDTDFKAPKIGKVQSSLDSGSGQLTVTLNASDADGPVVRVYIVAVGDPGTGSRPWTGVDLAQTGATNQWSGSLTVPGNPNVVKFLVQAVDSSGNVGFATNKARNFNNDGTVVVDPPSPDLTTTVNGPLDAGLGWYTGNVTVAVSLPAELNATYSVTPGVSNAQLVGSSFPINGNGTFSWQVTTSDGQTNSGIVAIDSADPVASLSPPTDGASYFVGEVPSVSFLCTDPSLVGCNASVAPGGTLGNGDPLPNAVGTYTVSVTATDIFGNSDVATATYSVIPAGEGIAIGDIEIDGVALPGQAVDVWGEFTGGVGPYTITVDWGDGATCPSDGSCTVSPPDIGEAGMIDAGYTYPAGGAFDVVVTVSDSTGASSSVTLTTATCTIIGNNRNNLLRGTGGDDVICGLGGNDRIFGRGGNDLIFGGSGNDRLYGDAGDDVIYGGRGNDYIVGSNGDDTLIGGRGNDDIFGGSGNDILKGRLNNDRLFGSGGDDTLIGNRGTDKLYGGSGNDDLQGRRNNDQIYGQAGDDTISGGQGSDLVNGGNGNDTINGDAGDDDLSGGRGNDTIIGGDGLDRCRGNAGTDIIDPSCEI